VSVQREEGLVPTPPRPPAPRPVPRPTPMPALSSSWSSSAHLKTPGAQTPTLPPPRPVFKPSSAQRKNHVQQKPPQQLVPAPPQQKPALQPPAQQHQHQQKHQQGHQLGPPKFDSVDCLVEGCTAFIKYVTSKALLSERV
jgi:hypothetical protein